VERKYQIIIISLVIVIIALAGCFVYMAMGGNFLTNSASIPQGMEMYDFNSEFKMAVPANAKFLKTWNNTDDGFMPIQGYSYFDKNNEIAINYMDSPFITHEFIDEFIKMDNSSGNATVEYEGDLIIVHNIKNNGKVGKTFENSKFKEGIAIQKGHMMVLIAGNDLDKIKSMANTIEFYE